MNRKAEEKEILEKLPDPKEETEYSLEEILEKLETIVERLGDGQCSLEQSFSLYKEGMDLLRESTEKIDRIEKRMLQIGKEGELHEFSGKM